jgi:hypothetical protein
MNIGNKLDGMKFSPAIHQVPNKTTGLNLNETFQNLCKNRIQILGFIGCINTLELLSPAGTCRIPPPVKDLDRSLLVQIIFFYLWLLVYLVHHLSSGFLQQQPVLFVSQTVFTRDMLRCAMLEQLLHLVLYSFYMHFWKQEALSENHKKYCPTAMTQSATIRRSVEASRKSKIQNRLFRSKYKSEL